MKLYLAAALVLVGSASAEPTKIWSVLDGAPDGHRLFNRRLEDVKKTYIKVDWEATKAHLEGPGASRGEKNEISFELPSGHVTCGLGPSDVMHPDLAAKIPELASLTGSCSDGSRITLNAVVSAKDSLSATFVTRDNQFVYVDNAERDTDVYVVYRFKDARRTFVEEENPFNCSVSYTSEKRALGSSSHDHEDAASFLARNRNLLRRETQTTTNGYKFRIAMVANNQYSAYHGNTLASVTAALVTLLTRVNGVYMRELGVFFQLIPDNDKLICLPGVAGCAQAPNDQSMIDFNGPFIASKGITVAQFDIGHGVSTGSGGVAGYPSLCVVGRKADGTTGTPQPVNDPFSIDYVSHEIGHQCMGAHSFRDCGGSNFMADGAVEPGSGSSIMGYAGICGNTNLQTNSDPYFNSNNLEMMRTFVEQVAQSGGCGETIATTKARPTVTVPSQCTVPANSKFVLTGSTATEGFYAWDRVDRGPANYLSTNTPRMRAWKPTVSKSRFVPNLAYVINGITEAQQLNEILPKTAGSMVFRFIARTLFDNAGVAPTQTADLIGDFGYGDMTVAFDPAIAPLTVDPVSTQLTPMTQHTFTWTVGGTAALSPKVRIFIAENLVPTVTADSFDYEEHEVPLKWFLVAAVDNTGSATVTIPQLVDNKPINAIVMIRGDNEACTFYDLSAGVSLAAVSGEPTVPANPDENGRDADGSTGVGEGSGLDEGSSSGVLVGAGVGGALVLGLMVAFFVRSRRSPTQSNMAPPYGSQYPPPNQAVAPYVGNGYYGGDPKAMMQAGNPQYAQSYY